jgi:hypothetical protein
MSSSHIAVFAVMLACGAFAGPSPSRAATVTDLTDVVDSGIFSTAALPADADRRILAAPREMRGNLHFYSRLDRWKHAESGKSALDRRHDDSI